MRLGHDAKAPMPISAKDVGNDTDERLEHPKKELSPSAESEDGSTKDKRLEHDSKALLPMTVKDVGMDTDERAEQLKKE